MTFEEILSLATTKQKVIQPKYMGMGGHKGTRYFYDNGTVIEVGQGSTTRRFSGRGLEKIRSVNYSNITVKRGDDKLFFIGEPTQDKIYMIEDIIKKP